MIEDYDDELLKHYSDFDDWDGDHCYCEKDENGDYYCCMCGDYEP